MKKQTLSVRTMTACAASLAIATILSFITVYQMPQGGSISPCSMFFVALPGFLFGPAVGILSGVVYGLLDFALKPYFLSVFQFIFDYILAFGVLGLSGFFTSKRWGLPIGYITGVFGRFVFTTLSGVIFFYMYAGDQNVWVYSAGYNASYIVPEAVFTLIIISLPPFQNALSIIKAKINS